MKKPIYFSKVEYVEHWGKHKSIILLNLSEGELSYQLFEERQQMPAIQGIETIKIFDYERIIDFCRHARVVKSGKTEFEPKVVADENWVYSLVFSKGFKLTQARIEKLLPYCNALDFEPYRDREMSMDDEGFIGYRDAARLEFRAVTDDCIPMIELPMDYYYDKAHIWPSEKLYRYILKIFFEGNSQMKGMYMPYGGLSLFFDGRDYE